MQQKESQLRHCLTHKDKHTLVLYKLPFLVWRRAFRVNLPRSARSHVSLGAASLRFHCEEIGGLEGLARLYLFVCHEIRGQNKVIEDVLVGGRRQQVGVRGSVASDRKQVRVHVVAHLYSHLVSGSRCSDELVEIQLLKATRLNFHHRAQQTGD